MTEISSRRAILRSQTARQHASLERVVGPMASASAYARYALGLHAFRAPVEATFRSFDWEGHGFGPWRPTLIAAALEQDLADLGLRPLSSPSAPALPSAPAFGGRDGALGVLYVLEGSSLGARLIYRDALKLGFSGQNGARHLDQQARGLETWRGFLALLDAAQDLDLTEAVLAANATFEVARLSFLNVDQHVS